VSFKYRGLAVDGLSERFECIDKRLPPQPNYVMHSTAQQNVKAATSSFAAQARSSGKVLPTVPLDFNIQQGATGRNVHDMQRVISSYEGYDQPRPNHDGKHGAL
jgi:hypothetical protein